MVQMRGGTAGFWQADRPPGYASRRWPTPPVLAIYEHFRRGEYGQLGDQEAPQGSFTATNMLVTRDGRLIVRPGWRDITPSGLATGPVCGFAWIGVVGRDVHYIQGTAVNRFDSTNPAGGIAAEGTIGVTPTKPADVFQLQGTLYWTVFGDKTYKTDVGAGTTTALTGSPGGRCVCIYGDRMIVGGLSGFPNRIQISDAANFNSWTSTSIIDVGQDGWEIRALLPMRNFLVIVRQDLSVYVLTGAADGTGTLRRHVGFPRNAQGGAVMWPGRVTLDLSSNEMWGVAQEKIVPLHFTGAKYEHLTDINFAPAATGIDQGDTVLPVYGATFGHQVGDCFLMDRVDNTFAMRTRGVWTKHSFNPAQLRSSGYVESDGTEAFYMTDGGAAGVTPHFYRLALGDLDNRAPVNGDGFHGDVAAADAQSGSTNGNQVPPASVAFPQWYAAFGFEVVVRYVIVDFEVWDPGAPCTLTNHLDVTLTALDVFDNISGDATHQDTKSWDEVQGTRAQATRMSRRFAFAAQGWGRGFQISLANVRGVKIRRVSVYGQLQPERLE